MEKDGLSCNQISCDAERGRPHKRATRSTMCLSSSSSPEDDSSEDGPGSSPAYITPEEDAEFLTENSSKESSDEPDRRAVQNMAFDEGADPHNSCALSRQSKKEESCDRVSLFPPDPLPSSSDDSKLRKGSRPVLVGCGFPSDPSHSNSTMPKSKKFGTFYSGILVGLGFPSGSPRSSGTIPALEGIVKLQEYREASDSEWDAIEEAVLKEQRRLPMCTKSPYTDTRRGTGRSEIFCDRSRGNALVKTKSSSGFYSKARQREAVGFIPPGPGICCSSNSEERGKHSVSIATGDPQQDRVDISSTPPEAGVPLQHKRVSGRRGSATGTLAFKNSGSNGGAPRGRRVVDMKDFERACRYLLDSEEEQDVDVVSPDVAKSKGSAVMKIQEGTSHSKRPTLSSKMIDIFVEADVHAGMEFDGLLCPGNPVHMDVQQYNDVRTFFDGISLSQDSLSVSVDLHCFPPKLTSRPENSLLRPVIIDGGAVVGCFNKEYSPYWRNIRDSTKLSWTSCKVLSMKPIYICLIEFLLRGHKVTVLLPAYYAVSSIGCLRDKVDDTEALNVLIDLNIIKFIGKSVTRKVDDEILDHVNEVDGLLVSSGWLDLKNAWPLAPTFASQASETYQSPSAFTQASKRMLTPAFFGRNQDMVIVDTFFTKEGGKWRGVSKEIVFYYNPIVDSDRNINDAGRVSQQLLFEDQIKQVSAVKDLFEWTPLYRRGISALLRLNFLAKAV